MDDLGVYRQDVVSFSSLRPRQKSTNEKNCHAKKNGSSGGIKQLDRPSNFETESRLTIPVVQENVTNMDSRVQSALQNTFVIIPMLNEADSIGFVLHDLPDVAEVIVVDNGSTDNSPEIAETTGATVIREAKRGYGQACLTGIEYVASQVVDPERAIVAFIDGDYSDHPEELKQLIEAMVEEDCDFVVGSRSKGKREPGAMHFQAIFGNWLACSLMRLFWGAKFSDLGPFRAIRFPSLLNLEMCDTNFGWTIEMQIKAFRKRLRITEIPVSYRCRIGKSKISGTVSGTLKAGYKILYTIFKYRIVG